MRPALFLACGLSIGMLLSAEASAQAYPAKPVRVIVPTPAGGNPDFIARPVLQKMGENLKHAFIIDNRPGAAGTIGVELAVRAVPDGYTLLFGAIGHVTSPPALYEKLAYDAAKDLAPISRLADAPFALFVHPSLPVKSVRELVALAIGSTRRLPVAAEIPTFAEAGFPNFVASAWFGLFAPAGAPREIVARLHGEAVKALASPEIREHFERAGIEPIGSTPEEFAQLVRSDIARFGKIARAAGIRAE